MVTTELKRFVKRSSLIVFFEVAQIMKHDAKGFMFYLGGVKFYQFKSDLYTKPNGKGRNNRSQTNHSTQ